MTVESRPIKLDEEALSRYLQRTADELALERGFTVTRVPAGHSNLTYTITSGGRKFVLRRPPPGPLPPSAHDVRREFRILERLAHSDLRVPSPIMLCEDASVIGAPFYLMEYVDGLILRRTVPDALAAPADRRAVSEDVVEMLAELHAADWRAIGLDRVITNSSDYLPRQTARWSRMLEHNSTRALPGLDEVTRWMVAGMPVSPPPTIVHGDFKLDNIIIQPGSPPRCVALLDWELSTIGDPLADLAWLMVWWADPGETMEEPLTLCSATAQGGFLTRDELRELYERRTGRDTTHIRWYEVFGLWRLAILFEGSFRRFISGMSDDPFFAELEIGVPKLIERARTLMEA